MLTLTQVLGRYIDSSPDLRSARKLRHQVNRWKRIVGNESAKISTREVELFRKQGVAAGLSPTTIETTISDVLTILRMGGGIAPLPGRRLNRPVSLAIQPDVADIGKLYAVADQACWPRRWTQQERTNWWRAFLYFGYLTAFRVGDMRRLMLNGVFDSATESHPRIELIASKTRAIHAFPLTTEGRSHLAMLKTIGGNYDGTLFRLKIGSVRFLRKEMARLARLAGVASIGPQMIRRASLTSWACCGDDCGRLAHGGTRGLGVRSFYVAMIRVMDRGVERFELPPEMQAADQRDASDAAISQLVAVAKRLKRPEDIRRLARMAEAW